MYVFKIQFTCFSYFYQIFQGVGPSKKRAKVMAAEYALRHLGALDEVTDALPDSNSEVYNAGDFTADVTDRST